LLVGTETGLTVKRFADQIIQSWDRDEPSGVTVVTDSGVQYKTVDGGSHWGTVDFSSAMQKAWPQKRSNSFSVIASISFGPELLVAVSSYDWGAGRDEKLQGSAILYSRDSGQTFDVHAEMTGPHAHFRSLVSLPK
jgi:hypothetical protein